VRDLSVSFTLPGGAMTAVDRASFDVAPGEILGIVGESGSGKSQILFSLMGLLARNGRATGAALFDGQNLLALPEPALDRIRGVSMSMIFQDPMTSLNPYLRISQQMNEVLMTHRHMTEAQATEASIDLLNQVGIPEARARFVMYPHEFSGGMRQRVMIAMALLCQPRLLIADEPTTALDVTVQAQILELLAKLRRELQMATVLITHDLGVIAGLSDRVIVMYGGRVVEEAPVRQLFHEPQHPYTRGLLDSMPRLDVGGGVLPTIPGHPPNLQNLPAGCSFRPRCLYAMAICESEDPELRAIAPGRRKACHLEKLV
jgi:oligopeptide transport system ATP-binding protein